MTDNIITQEGYDKLIKELDELINIKRKEIAKRIQIAKDMGDLSENAEYSEAKDAHAFNEGRISEIQSLIKNLTVVDTKENNGAVTMGSKVSVKADGKEKSFVIVSFNEADPVQGKISNESPIGRALIDKKKGDVIKVQTPRGEIEYEIINVE